MEMRLDREAEDLEDQVTYLYKYELRCTVNTALTTKTAFEPAVAILVTVAGKALPSPMGFPAN